MSYLGHCSRGRSVLNKSSASAPSARAIFQVVVGIAETGTCAVFLL